MPKVELWGTNQSIPEKYDLDFKKLLDDFPAQQLYLHPVKLSKWNICELKRNKSSEENKLQFSS